MGNAILQCEGMTQAFGSQTILDSINLTVQQGETLTVVGPSGCGKTTLLRGIAGLDRLNKGKIFLNGIDITEQRAERRPIVLMFQQPLLFPHLTVLDNILYGLRVSKLDKKQRLQLGQELLEKIELAAFAARYPSVLSGGQQQRVSLARALAVRPQLLLLDEPFSSLDPDLRVSIRNWVHELLKTESITSIFVTHDKEEAMLMGDRVAVMLDGRIQQIGKPLEVYLRPHNPKVAQFFSEGLLLEDGSFVPISNIRMTTVDQQQADDGQTVLTGKITGKWIKSGQLIYQVFLEQYDSITLSATEEYLVNTAVTLSFHSSDRIYFK